MQNKLNIIKRTVTITIVTVLFACTSNYNDIKKLHQISKKPASITEYINLKHTDSGEVKIHLISDKMIDFSNKKFSYTTFPKGLEVYFFDDKKQKTTVTSNYAILYNETDLIDLRGNVKVVTNDGKVLTAEQLYYDQKTKWLFTNSEYKYEAEDGGYNIGKGGFDANEDFTIFTSLDNDGEQYIKEEKENLTN